MTGLRPIEIVGGGLAGLSLGVALSREGVPVTLFEAGHYPRHRVCGEFITGLSAHTIARLRLAPILSDARRHHEVAWFLGSAAEDRPARHADPTPGPGRVFATGRRRSRSGWLGLKIHARGLALARDLELHLGAEAYVGLAGVEDGAVNICGLFRRRELCAKGANLLLGYLAAAGLTTLAARLAAAELEAGSFCAVAAVEFDPRVAPAVAGYAGIGDACAMIPPFSGNGMAMAFQGAESALDPLLAYAKGATAWTNACQSIDRALRRRFRLRLASASAVHSFLYDPPRQRLLGALSRAQLLPLRPLYAALH